MRNADALSRWNRMTQVAARSRLTDHERAARAGRDSHDLDRWRQALPSAPTMRSIEPAPMGGIRSWAGSHRDGTVRM